MLKLIESLRHCTVSEGDCRSCPRYTHDSGCLDRLHIEAADLLESQQKRIAELEEKNRRIPVTERLPKESGYYIVTACDEGCSYGEGIWYSTVVVVAEYYNGTWTWYEGSMEYSLEGIVTHWMPMLEPPKEVQ